MSTDVSSSIREKVGVVYGAENLSFAAFSPFGRAISVSLLGNNIETLEAATNELKAEMKKRDDIKDVTDSNQDGLQEISVTLLPRAYQLGFNEQELLAQIRQAFYGHEVQRLQRGRDEVRVWVRLDERDRASIGSLENFRLRTASGDEIPFTEVCEINIERGVTAIKRLYGQREVQVSADLSGPKSSATEMLAIAEASEGLGRVPAVEQEQPEVHTHTHTKKLKSATCDPNMQLSAEKKQFVMRRQKRKLRGGCGWRVKS